VSIGISVFPRDGATVTELIRRADEAMYVAKGDKSGFAFAQ
jgi:GGDEF domain-containing protein